jgi:hypothetical protein
MSDETKLPKCAPVVAGKGSTHWYECPHCGGVLDLPRPKLAPEHVEALMNLIGEVMTVRNRVAIRAALAALGEEVTS